MGRFKYLILKFINNFKGSIIKQDILVNILLNNINIINFYFITKNILLLID